MIEPSGKGSFPSRYALIATSLPSLTPRLFTFALFVGHGDHCPVAIPRSHLRDENRGGISVGFPGCEGDGTDSGDRHSDANQKESDPHHMIAPVDTSIVRTYHTPGLRPEFTYSMLIASPACYTCVPLGESELPRRPSGGSPIPGCFNWRNVGEVGIKLMLTHSIRTGWFGTWSSPR